MTAPMRILLQTTITATLNFHRDHEGIVEAIASL